MALPYPYGLTQDEVEAAYGDVRLAAERKFQAVEDEIRTPLTDEQKKAEWKSIFMEQVSAHRDNLKLWMDGDGKVWLGWFRKAYDGERIVIRALVQMKTGTLVAVPLRQEKTDAVEGVAWCRPWMGIMVWEKVIEKYRLIIPAGTF